MAGPSFEIPGNVIAQLISNRIARGENVPYADRKMAERIMQGPDYRPIVRHSNRIIDY